MDVLIGVACRTRPPRHLGHLAGAYLPADVAARYYRLTGDRVLLVSGPSPHPRSRWRPSGPGCRRRPLPTASTSASRPASPAPASPSTTTPRRRPAGTTPSPRSCSRASTGAGSSPRRPSRPPSAPARPPLPDRYVEGTCPARGAPDARGDQCDACGRTLDPEELAAAPSWRCGGPAELRPPRQAVPPPRPAPAGGRALPRRPRDGLAAVVGAEARGWTAASRPRAITRDLDWGAGPPARLGRPPPVRLVRRRHRLPVGLLEWAAP